MTRVRTSIIVVTIASGLAAIGYGTLAAQEERTGPTRVKLAACAESAWKVEALTLFGDKDVILEKLARHEDSMGLQHNRVFVFLVETDDSADLAMYERTDGEHCNVTHWSTGSVGDLAEQILKQVSSSKGRSCAGMLTKALVAKRAGKENLKSETVVAPKSARKAIGEALEKHRKEFLRLTLFVLC
jgi:hypothetical protein